MAAESEQLKTIEQKAASLLKAEPQSAVSLRQQLVKLGFERPAITKTLKNTDWVEQGRRVAAQLFPSSRITPDLLASYLAGHGFTIDVRRAVIRSLDWSECALAHIQAYLREPWSESEVSANMSDVGFTSDQISTALRLSPVNWSAALDGAVQEMLQIGASRKRIVNRLRVYGYDAGDIRRRLRNLHVNWNQEALRTLISLQFGNAALYDWLKEDPREMGFTPSQTQWAVESLEQGAPEAVSSAAEIYLQTHGVSETDFREKLKVSGFPDAAVKEAIRSVASVDWVKAALAPIATRLRQYYFGSRKDSEDRLRSSGYTKAQIEAAIRQLKPDWKEHAYQFILLHESIVGLQTKSRSRQLLLMAGFTKEETEWALRQRYGDAAGKASAYREACLLGVDFPSKKATRGALLHAGFSKKDVDDAMRRLCFNWREHALRRAKSILEIGMESRRIPYPVTILQYLSDAGFTKGDTRDVIEKLPVPWDEIAAQVIQDEKNSCCGMSYIESLLQERQFPPASIEEGKRLAKADEIDWKEQAKYSLARALDLYVEPAQIRRMMLSRGLTEEDVDYAFAHTVIPKNIDWNKRGLSYAQEIQEVLHLSPRELKAELKREYLTDSQIEYVIKRMRPLFIAEAKARALDMLEDGATPRSVPEALRAAGFSARDVRAVANFLGVPTPN